MKKKLQILHYILGKFEKEITHLTLSHYILNKFEMENEYHNPALHSEQSWLVFKMQEQQYLKYLKGTKHNYFHDFKSL